jgi:hypothetical protein
LFLHSFLYVTKPKRVCAKKSETYHNGHYSGMSEIISEGWISVRSGVKSVLLSESKTEKSSLIRRMSCLQGRFQSVHWAGSGGQTEVLIWLITVRPDRTERVSEIELLVASLAASLMREGDS